MTYGDLPIDLGKFDINWNENCFYLYLPIKMAGSMSIKIPDRLKIFNPLINKTLSRILGTEINNTEWYRLISRYESSFSKERHDSLIGRYLYLTVKHFLVNPAFWGQRGGAHCDGFGTNDINWIWYDENPTEFNTGPFTDISEHEHKSLKQFEAKWNDKNTVTYPEKHLLELTPFVVHRVARVTRYMMRTFVKISLSEHKYNLVGNSHNYLFDYKWEMHDRQVLRNKTHNNNQDYVPDDIA